jgi:hypothetical protein
MEQITNNFVIAHYEILIVPDVPIVNVLGTNVALI